MVDAVEFRRMVLEELKLPKVATPMILRPGETAYLRVQRAVWRELRGSPGASG